VLIVWQTVALLKIMKSMGDVLNTERRRLNYLMYIFAISYFSTSAYYIVQLATDLHCTAFYSCTRFIDLMFYSGTLFFFDVIPVGVLYYQHYKTST
jgi:hypothetical protein